MLRVLLPRPQALRVRGSPPCDPLVVRSSALPLPLPLRRRSPCCVAAPLRARGCTCRAAATAPVPPAPRRGRCRCRRSRRRSRTPLLAAVPRIGTRGTPAVVSARGGDALRVPSPSGSRTVCAAPAPDTPSCREAGVLTWKNPAGHATAACRPRRFRLMGHRTRSACRCLALRRSCCVCRVGVASLRPPPFFA